jgi:beta-phosphoglucomutase family hydrolase
MKRAVIFDMDGVISDSEPLHASADVEVLSGIGIHVSEHEIEKFAGISSSIIFEKYLAQAKRPLGLASELVQKKYAVLQRKSGEIRAVPGVVELIRLLKANGWALAVASASRKIFIRTVLDTLKVSDCFDVIASVEDVQRGKPAPDVFLKASELLGVPPARCIVIEDATAGVEAAKAAKMKCIGYAGSSGGQRLDIADLIVSDFTTLESSMLLDLLPLRHRK